MSARFGRADTTARPRRAGGLTACGRPNLERRALLAAAAGSPAAVARNLATKFRVGCRRGRAPGDGPSHPGATARSGRHSSSNAPALSVPERAAPPAGARYSCSAGWADAASASGTVMPSASAPAVSV